MFRRIQGFRFGLEQARNPFDPHPELSGQHDLFLYLTGRGEYSYVFPPMAESDIIEAAAQSIPMGYTQIWILEWINAVRPEPRKKIKPFQRRATHHLRPERFQEGHSYILLGENARCFGGAETLPAALGASKVIAVESAVRIAIGLLKATVMWH